MQKVMSEPKLTYQTITQKKKKKKDISESTYNHLFTPPIPKLSFCFFLFFYMRS